MSVLRISPDAIEADLAELARFSLPGPGVTRLAWSDQLRSANRWAERRMRALGLTVESDAAGNLFGRLDSGSGPPVLVGSHLDSVPNGGRFDGALGVVGALRAVEAIVESGARLGRPIWIVSWMDEEGSRFGTGLLGSRVFAGKNVGDVAQRTDDAGLTLEQAMHTFGRDVERLTDARNADGVLAYLELHIEQGPTLARSGTDLGIVTGTAGLWSFTCEFRGVANHAGTTPMNSRRDALFAAARATVALREYALAHPGMTANVSRIQADSGASNIIPTRASMTIEVRAAEEPAWRQLPEAVRECVMQAARSEGVAAELEERHRLEPSTFDENLVALVEQAAQSEGAKTARMFSGAGHDAMSLADSTPVAMLFVPSVGGISHSPEEFSEPAACALGVRALARALLMIGAADEANRLAV